MKAMGSGWKLMAAAGLVAALGGCGGGGGGGGSSSSDFDDTDYPTPPSTEGSGLEAPSRVLTGERSEAVELLRNLSVEAWPQLPEAVALQALGTVSPAAVVGAGGTYACSSGNITSTGGSALATTLTYNNCVIEGYTFNGSATATTATDGSSYQITYSGLGLSGLDIDVATAEGATECQVNVATSALLGCVSQYPTGSTVEKENFVWGWDSGWDGSQANGTHQCGCTRTWNVTYADFTSTAGKAVISGSNGTAYIDRKGGNLYDVRVVIDGGTPIEYLSVGI